MPVAVIGGGLAGLVAAISAKQRDPSVDVTVYEKENGTGGNSSKASSGMAACHSYVQEKLGVNDSVNEYLEDLVSSAGNHLSKGLLDLLAERSGSACEFVRDVIGTEFDDVILCGGHSKRRVHRFAPDPTTGKAKPVGFTLTSAARRKCEALGVKFVTGARVVKILQHPAADTVAPGAVAGLVLSVKRTLGQPPSGAPPHAPAVSSPAQGSTEEREEVTVHAEAVIIASGGYAGDRSADSLLHRFCAPEVANLPTTNGPFATGDGIKLAEAAGAKLVDMACVQVHPTGFVDPADPANPTKFLCPEGVRGCGGLLLSPEGRRFASELTTREKLTAAIQEIGGTAFLVLTEAGAAAYGTGAVSFYASKGLLSKVEGLKGAAEYIHSASATLPATHGVVERPDPAALEKALEEELCGPAASGAPDRFGKPVLPAELRVRGKDDALYVGRVTPALHYTMGGIATSPCAEALFENHLGSLKPLPGLFVAGEAMGGLHGDNRLAGSSLLDTVVFGKIAGERAASLCVVDQRQAPLMPASFTPLALVSREAVGSVMCASDPSVALYQKLTFALPSPLQRCGLGVGQYVTLRARVPTADLPPAAAASSAPASAGSSAAPTPAASASAPLGDTTLIVRPYSPLSRPDDAGRIELLIKVDPAAGAMARHIAAMRVGDTIEFSGPFGGVDLFCGRVKHIALIGGGVGISPLVQIIRSVVASGSRQSLAMIYGASRERDLLFFEALKEKAQAKDHDFRLTTVLEHPPENWSGFSGYITEEVIRKAIPPPGPGVMVVICGPYPMCKAMKEMLPKMGYTKDMFYSYM